MLKYFDLLLDLLEMEADIDVGKYREIAIYIEENPKAKYKFLHRHGFLFQAFLDLVLGKIDEEVFIKMGDVESEINLYTSATNLENTQKILSSLKDNIVVIDMSVWNIISNDELKSLLAKHTVKILSC